MYIWYVHTWLHETVFYRKIFFLHQCFCFIKAHTDCLTLFNKGAEPLNNLIIYQNTCCDLTYVHICSHKNTNCIQYAETGMSHCCTKRKAHTKQVCSLETRLTSNSQPSVSKTLKSPKWRAKVKYFREKEHVKLINEMCKRTRIYHHTSFRERAPQAVT